MKPWNEYSFLLFDGGMGTQLQKRITERILPEEANLRYPQIIEQIQGSYAQAGAHVITANTFGANHYKLALVGLEPEPVIEAAVAIARKATGDGLVALDIGPLGKMLEPTGELSFQEAYEAFKRQVIAGTKAGCDLILIETMSDLQEARCAVLAAKENADLPVFCTMTFDDKGRTMTGTDPRSMVAVLEGLGVDALGVNCSLGPDKLLPIVEEILTYASVPVMVQPNAGMPVYRDGVTSYDITKEDFARTLARMAQMGVLILGGCCGTDAEYIRLVRESLDVITPRPLTQKTHTVVCSHRRSVLMDGNITIVSENALPHGNAPLMEAFIKEDVRKIAAKVKSSKNKGAHIVDIRAAGVPGKDEKALMVEIITALQKSLDVPLMLESRNSQALEAGLRIYNGKAIVNGLDGTKRSLETLLPVVKKYGAAVVALTMDEEGPAVTWEKRVEIAGRILKAAEALGIQSRNVIFDPVVLPVANGADAMATLHAMTAIKEKWGVKVLLGLGNVSYKMPRRELLDRTYLAMALSHGMDALLMNVEQEDLWHALQAGQVLTGKDPGGMEYAAKVGELPAVRDDLDDAANLVYQGQWEDDRLLQVEKTSIVKGLLASETAYQEGIILLPNLRRSVTAAQRGIQGPFNRGTVVFTGDVRQPGLAFAMTLAGILGFATKAAGAAVMTDPVVCIALDVPFGTGVSALEEQLKPLQQTYPDAAVFLVGPGAKRMDWKSLGLAGAIQKGSDWLDALETL